MSLKRNIQDLRQRKIEVQKGGGDEAIEKQVARRGFEMGGNGISLLKY